MKWHTCRSPNIKIVYDYDKIVTFGEWIWSSVHCLAGLFSCQVKGSLSSGVVTHAILTLKRCKYSRETGAPKATTSLSIKISLSTALTSFYSLVLLWCWCGPAHSIRLLCYPAILVLLVPWSKKRISDFLFIVVWRIYHYIGLFWNIPSSCVMLFHCMYISIDYLSKTKLGHFWIVQGKCYSNMNFIYILKLERWQQQQQKQHCSSYKFQ